MHINKQYFLDLFDLNDNFLFFNENIYLQHKYESAPFALITESDGRIIFRAGGYFDNDGVNVILE